MNALVQSKITLLRSMQGILNTVPKTDFFRCSIFSEGIPRGAVSEISGADGSGKTEFVLRLVAENLKIKVAWLEEDFSAYPSAFPQLGVALERVLFIEAGSRLLWATIQTIRSGLFEMVVVSNAQFKELELRRLQLLSERANNALLLLPEAPSTHGTWPLALQLLITRPEERKLNPRVIKKKTGT